MMCLRVAERMLQLVETDHFELDALLLPSEETVYIWDICPDIDSHAQIVADDASRCVKFIAASNRAALLFQCGPNSRPRALQLVRPVAGGGTTLLLVEWLESEQQSGRYALVVFERSGEKFQEKQPRIHLSALSKGKRLATVSMATTSGGFVLIGNTEAEALEVIDARDSSGIARLAPLPLKFKLFAFSMGTADGKELLAATDGTTRIVHVLQLEAASGAPTLLPYLSLTAGGENHLPDRVLIFGQHVLISIKHASSTSHAVDCFPISGAPHNSTPSQVLGVEKQVRISCWRAAGKRVLLFDVNHKQLSSLECVSRTVFCTFSAFSYTVRGTV